MSDQQTIKLNSFTFFLQDIELICLLYTPPGSKEAVCYLGLGSRTSLNTDYYIQYFN